jgi:hypothetical protein
MVLVADRPSPKTAPDPYAVPRGVAPNRMRGKTQLGFFALAVTCEFFEIFVDAPVDVCEARDP